MTISDWLGQHSISDTIVLFWIFSAIVNAMPEPASDKGVYKAIYTFLTFIVGHLNDMINQRQTRQSSAQSAPQGEKKQ